MSLEVNVEKRTHGFTLQMRFEVASGLSVLFGDSGAGKTLTLRMIAGLLRPDQGRVSLDEQVLSDQEARIWVPPQARRIGFVFQHESLFPHLTVHRNILFGGRELPGAERHARARDLLEELQLEGLADKTPAEISGGQKQRAVIARTLMQRPRALLLDEPFSALDLPSRKHMRACLTQVMRDLAIPVILVTHDLVEALTLPDRLLILDQGRVVQEGPPEAIVAHPTNDHVAALVDPENLRIPFLSRG